jgi:hypothetical protein
LSSFLKFLGWIRIVLSPLLISLFIAVPIYYNKPDSVGISIAIVLASAGLFIGIKWANRTWKKHGTQQFISRISSSTDLDSRPEDERKT